MSLLFRNQSGFTLVEVLCVGIVAGILALIVAKGHRSAEIAQRAVASRSEATAFKNSLQLIVRDRCSCDKALVGQAVDPRPAFSKSVTVMLPGSTSPSLASFAGVGQRMGQFREVTELAVSDMVELGPVPSAVADVPNKIYWANLKAQTMHKMGNAAPLDSREFTIPIKLIVEPVGNTIVGCYAVSADPC